MIKKLLFSACMIFSAQAFTQTAPGKYRSVSDSTGMISAFYLTSDTTRINNPSLLPPGTAIPLYDRKEKQVARYILNDKRTWVFTPDEKDPH